MDRQRGEIGSTIQACVKSLTWHAHDETHKHAGVTLETALMSLSWTLLRFPILQSHAYKVLKSEIERCDFAVHGCVDLHGLGKVVQTLVGGPWVNPLTRAEVAFLGDSLNQHQDGDISSSFDGMKWLTAYLISTQYRDPSARCHREDVSKLGGGSVVGGDGSLMEELGKQSLVTQRVNMRMLCVAVLALPSSLDLTFWDSVFTNGSVASTSQTDRNTTAGLSSDVLDEELKGIILTSIQPPGQSKRKVTLKSSPAEISSLRNVGPITCAVLASYFNNNGDTAGAVMQGRGGEQIDQRKAAQEWYKREKISPKFVFKTAELVATEGCRVEREVTASREQAHWLRPLEIIQQQSTDCVALLCVAIGAVDSHDKVARTHDWLVDGERCAHGHCQFRDKEFEVVGRSMVEVTEMALSTLSLKDPTRFWRALVVVRQDSHSSVEIFRKFLLRNLATKSSVEWVNSLRNVAAAVSQSSNYSNDNDSSLCTDRLNRVLQSVARCLHECYAHNNDASVSVLSRSLVHLTNGKALEQTEMKGEGPPLPKFLEMIKLSQEGERLCVRRIATEYSSKKAELREEMHKCRTYLNEHPDPLRSLKFSRLVAELRTLRGSCAEMCSIVCDTLDVLPIMLVDMCLDDDGRRGEMNWYSDVSKSSPSPLCLPHTCPSLSHVRSVMRVPLQRTSLYKFSFTSSLFQHHLREYLSSSIVVDVVGVTMLVLSAIEKSGAADIEQLVAAFGEWISPTYASQQFEYVLHSGDVNRVGRWLKFLSSFGDCDWDLVFNSRLCGYLYPKPQPTVFSDVNVHNNNLDSPSFASLVRSVALLLPRIQLSTVSGPLTSTCLSKRVLWLRQHSWLRDGVVSDWGGRSDWIELARWLQVEDMKPKGNVHESITRSRSRTFNDAADLPQGARVLERDQLVLTSQCGLLLGEWLRWEALSWRDRVLSVGGQIGSDVASVGHHTTRSFNYFWSWLHHIFVDTVYQSVTALLSALAEEVWLFVSSSTLPEVERRAVMDLVQSTPFRLVLTNLVGEVSVDSDDECWWWVNWISARFVGDTFGPASGHSGSRQSGHSSAGDPQLPSPGGASVPLPFQTCFDVLDLIGPPHNLIPDFRFASVIEPHLSDLLRHCTVVSLKGGASGRRVKTSGEFEHLLLHLAGCLWVCYCRSYENKDINDLEYTQSHFVDSFACSKLLYEGAVDSHPFGRVWETGQLLGYLSLRHQSAHVPITPTTVRLLFGLPSSESELKGDAPTDSLDETIRDEEIDDISTALRMVVMGETKVAKSEKPLIGKEGNAFVTPSISSSLVPPKTQSSGSSKTPNRSGGSDWDQTNCDLFETLPNRTQSMRERMRARAKERSALFDARRLPTKQEDRPGRRWSTNEVAHTERAQDELNEDLVKELQEDSVSLDPSEATFSPQTASLSGTSPYVGQFPPPSGTAAKRKSPHQHRVRDQQQATPTSAKRRLVLNESDKGTEATNGRETEGLAASTSRTSRHLERELIDENIFALPDDSDSGEDEVVLL